MTLLTGPNSIGSLIEQARETAAKLQGRDETSLRQFREGLQKAGRDAELKATFGIMPSAASQPSGQFTNPYQTIREDRAEQDRRLFDAAKAGIPINQGYLNNKADYNRQTAQTQGDYYKGVTDVETDATIKRTKNVADISADLIRLNDEVANGGRNLARDIVFNQQSNDRYVVDRQLQVAESMMKPTFFDNLGSVAQLLGSIGAGIAMFRG